MAANAPRIGWIGAGRMGLPMAELLVKAGNDVTVWNRTRRQGGAAGASSAPRMVKSAADLSGLDIVFSIVSTGKDLEEVYLGPGGVTSGKGKLPAIFVDCSTIGVEESARVPCAPRRGRRPVHRLARQRQRPGDPRAQALRRGVRPRGRLPPGRAPDQGVRAGRRVLRRRGRAGARVQDRPQRDAGRRHREPDRDHAAVQQDRACRATPSWPSSTTAPWARCSRATSRRRWSTSTGPPPSRPELLRKDLDLGLEARPRAGGADAGDRGRPRDAADPHRRGPRSGPTAEKVLAADFAQLAETMARAAGMKLESEEHVPRGRAG